MSKDRKTRFQYGRDAEWAVLLRLMCSGRHYVLCGQEHWLPPYCHSRLRSIHGNKTVDAIRHFPDFATNDYLIQVKSAPEWDGHPTVTIESASLDTSRELSSAGMPVLLVWHFPERMPGEHSLYAQFADKINPRESSMDRHNLNGSMTPMLLVPINQLKPLSAFGL